MFERNTFSVHDFDEEMNRSSSSRALHFIKYNNAVPIGVAFLVLSFSGALAASPEVRSDVANAVYSETQTVKSVDNTYLVGKDLTNYVPAIQITNVTEDIDNYYVSYAMQTIDVVDYAWKDTTIAKTLQVPKADLQGGDLGLYVAKQLKNIQDWEISRLQDTQKIEKQKGPQQQIVATAYSGLIGKFLDPKETVLPGYTPVIAPAPDDQTTSASSSGSSSSSSAGGSSSASQGGLAIQILGMNPSQIPQGGSYMDLGAFLVKNGRIGVDAVTGTGIVDTTKLGSYTITYSATDPSSGAAVTATRTVIVYDPLKGPPIDPSTIQFQGGPALQPQDQTSTTPAPAFTNTTTPTPASTNTSTQTSATSSDVSAPAPTSTDTTTAPTTTDSTTSSTTTTTDTTAAPADTTTTTATTDTSPTTTSATTTSS